MVQYQLSQTIELGIPSNNKVITSLLPYYPRRHSGSVQRHPRPRVLYLEIVKLPVFIKKSDQRVSFSEWGQSREDGYRCDLVDETTKDLWRRKTDLGVSECIYPESVFLFYLLLVYGLVGHLFSGRPTVDYFSSPLVVKFFPL